MKGYDGNEYDTGDRVELHPGCGLWMQGARFGTVVGTSITHDDRVKVELDDQTEANAARIVACVNALEGIANPSAVAELIAAASETATASNPYVVNNQRSRLSYDRYNRLRAALAALDSSK